mgnify:CR=1 FL=1
MEIILDMKDFHVRPQTNKIICGIRWKVITNIGIETHECFQFDTLDELKVFVVELFALSNIYSIDILTHLGQYRQVKTVISWQRR